MSFLISPQTLRKRPQPGFSYVEVMVAIVIVAVSVVALVQSLTATTKVNASARESGVAVNLVRNVHEYAMGIGVFQLDALNGRTFTKPIGSDGAELDGYLKWSQYIEVTRVMVDATHDIKTDVATTTTTRLRRLVVHARYDGQDVYSESWIIAPTGF